MAHSREDPQVMKSEHQRVLEPSPTFTRDKWDEVMRWRMARIFEAGERIPTLDELLTAMKNAIEKTRGAR